MTNYLVCSDGSTNISASPQAIDFARSVHHAVRSLLKHPPLQWQLLPFRESDRQVVGLDIIDSQQQAFTLTLQITGETKLPEVLGQTNVASVVDATDAIHLCWLIVDELDLKWPTLL